MPKAISNQELRTEIEERLEWQNQVLEPMEKLAQI
jgi:hypothetical protein